MTLDTHEDTLVLIKTLHTRCHQFESSACDLYGDDIDILLQALDILERVIFQSIRYIH